MEGEKETGNNFYRLVSFWKTANTRVWKIILGLLTKPPKDTGLQTSTSEVG